MIKVESGCKDLLADDYTQAMTSHHVTSSLRTISMLACGSWVVVTSAGVDVALAEESIKSSLTSRDVAVESLVDRLTLTCLLYLR